MSTLLELTELDETVPTPSMSFILSVIFVSTSDLFIIVVFPVVVVFVVLVTLYPLAVSAFFTAVSVAEEFDPFNISTLIFPASVLLTELADDVFDDVFVDVLLVVLFVVVFVFEVFVVLVAVFSVVELDVSSSPEPYNSFINSAVSFLSGIKYHNEYVGGPYDPPGITALCMLFTSILTAYGT